MTNLSLSLYPPPPPPLPLHLSLFLSLFLSKYYFSAMIMSFCKKSVHSFLGLTTTLDHTTTTTTTTDHKLPKGRISSLAGGGLGGLITATGDTQRPPHVLESASVKSTTITPPSSPPSMKKDAGGIGFLDDIGGGIDGLMSCTESLGFESSDERRVDDNIGEEMNSSNIDSTEGFYTKRRLSRMSTTRMKEVEVRKFPPPLSSLNKNGQPCFFLRPVRKDGRLELTEVRIDRPEILRASRQDGRLRLHLIRDNEEEEQEQEEEEEEVLEQEQEQEKEEVEEEGVEENVEEEEEEEEGVAEWKFPVSEEGFRRCQELVSHHNHHHRHHNHHHHHHSNHAHHLHVWSQHCVTTR